LVRGGNSGFANAAGQGCAWPCPKRVIQKNLGQLAQSKRSGRPSLEAGDAQNLGHNRPHAVGFPIRKQVSGNFMRLRPPPRTSRLPWPSLKRITTAVFLASQIRQVLHCLALVPISNKCQNQSEYSSFFKESSHANSI